MGTRLNPGKWDCYHAALPDEEQFVLNARDPAAAEAVRFWITLRQAMIGRGEKPAEDAEMLAEASACAVRMVAWRSDNKMVTIGEGEDAFVGPRWHHEKPPETQDEWEQAWLSALYQIEQTVSRLSQENASLRVLLADRDIEVERLTGQDTVNRQHIARLIDRAGELAGNVEDRDQTIREKNDEIVQVRSQLASCTMERDRQDDRLRDLARLGDQRIPLIAFPETTSEDLAEAPVINDHRFGSLEKFGDYAYARGLTVAPRHLPEALHQMEHDFGWRLLAIFGSTDSQSIGFVFKRAERHMTPDEIDRMIVDTLTSKSTFINRMLTGVFRRPSETVDWGQGSREQSFRAVNLGGKEA